MTSDEVYKLIEVNGLTLHGDIEHFAAIVASAERNDVLEEVAREFDAMRIAFGDTADSFARYVRDMKIEK
jgi:hypothetical protein